MTKTREQILEERHRLRAEYGALFNSIAALLFQADPIGISFDNENLDEYDPEVGTILPRLKDCASADDVLRVVHEEFVRWFDADNAGPASATNRSLMQFGSSGSREPVTAIKAARFLMAQCGGGELVHSL
jgi:hypothetical protein